MSNVRLISRIATSLACAGLLTFAFAEGPSKPDDAVMKRWMVRFRLLNMKTNSGSDAFSALGLNFAKDAIDVSSKWFPEVDFSYFFDPHWAAELVLTYPQQHDVNLAGVGNIGTIKHLPPTLMAQYHFGELEQRTRPYVGLGVNYTRITDSNLAAAGTALDVKRDSFGLAIQAGVDIQLKENLFLNFDYKYVGIKTKVYVAANGAYLTDVKVNPHLFSIGLGFKF